MPTSMPFILNHICSWILENQPQSILDIGVGFGKWGFLAREYTDIWHSKIQQKQWTTIIHGIEVFEPYISPAARYIYDDIFIGEATQVIKKLAHYDLIICTAMLEHLEKKQGLMFVQDCKKLASVCFFTLPVEPGRRSGKHGNKYQAHVSTWTRKELEQFGKVTRLKAINNWLLEIGI